MKKAMLRLVYAEWKYVKNIMELLFVHSAKMKLY